LRYTRKEEADYMKFVRDQAELGNGFRDWLGVKNAKDPQFQKRPGFDVMNDYLREAGESAVPVEPMNQWIDKQLTRYVKNDMATPEDPVRKLAERGMTHDPSVGEMFGRNFVHPTGEHYEQLAKNPMAQGWENASDNMLRETPMSEYQNFGSSNLTASEPWLQKLDPSTPMYRPKDNTVGVNLGFNHLIDELRSATDPASGLPRELMLKYSSLPQLSVPQAVERVAKINQWRADEAARVELETLKENLKQKPFKEYASGWRWAELPDSEADDGMKLVNAIGCQGGWCTKETGNARAYGSHKEGNKLYALIDPEGRPHTQIQVKPSATLTPEKRDAQMGFLVNRLLGEGMSEEQAMAQAAKLYPESETASRIIQIKPFSNSWDSQMVRDFTKKNPNYRKEIEPMLQDFVKSGKWSDVGDLQNSGLRKTSDVFGPTEMQKFKENGIEIPSFLGADEQRVLQDKWYTLETGKDPATGYAAGGPVQHFDAGGEVAGPGYTAGGDDFTPYDPAMEAHQARTVQEQAAHTKANSMSRDDFLKKYGPTFVADDKGGNPWTLDAKDFLSQVSPLMAKANYVYADGEEQLQGQTINGRVIPYAATLTPNSWSQRDETPQDVTLKLADGRVWTPSGHGNGIVFHPKGEVTEVAGPYSGSGEFAVASPMQQLINPQDYYEVSGDASKLLGKDQSGQKVTMRYKQVGDKMVPMDDAPAYEGYRQGVWNNGLGAFVRAGLGAAALGTGVSAVGAAGAGTTVAGTTVAGAAAAPASGLAGTLGMNAGLGATALNTGALNTGMGLLRGQNIGDALKSGATGALLSPVSGYVGDLVGGGTVGTLAGNTALGGVQGLISGKGLADGARDGFVNGLVSEAGSYMGGKASGLTDSKFAGTAANTLTQTALKGGDASAAIDSLASQYASGQLKDLTGLDPAVAKLVVAAARGKKIDPAGALTQYARSTANAVGSNALRRATTGNGAVGALTQTGG
jgi:hypothetical protein